MSLGSRVHKIGERSAQGERPSKVKINKAFCKLQTRMVGSTEIVALVKRKLTGSKNTATDIDIDEKSFCILELVLWTEGQ